MSERNIMHAWPMLSKHKIWFQHKAMDVLGREIAINELPLMSVADANKIIDSALRTYKPHYPDSTLAKLRAAINRGSNA